MSTEPTNEKFLPAENIVLTDLGPCLHEAGVTYRVWAFGHHKVTVQIERPTGITFSVALKQAKESGYFFGTDPHGNAGDLYKLSIDGGEPLPDFVSHYQPQGAFGPSMVVDAGAFEWQAFHWKRPAYTGLVIYECHLGTFTPEGTYRSAIEKLDYLAELGITALELMPLAEWAGNRNWGYDGTLLFAPTYNYGTPDDLRALVDACHLRGIAVILDVVFNHLGPEGNFSHQYSDFFFHEGKDNPWGQNFNLDGPNSEPVRALLRQNIRYWLTEFQIDGFRMDATHMVHDESSVHLLAEAAAMAHEYGAFMIAEDDRNARSILEPKARGGWGFDGVWSDDFHHAIRVSQTGDQLFFLSMFNGEPREIAEIVRKGWLYTGQYSNFHKANRGTPADDFPPQSFVFCISNHDQVGNRFQGERVHQSMRPSSYRAMSLFLCVQPHTPLLFMGQEWGASSPFHYFTDMSPELGELIFQGRTREFLHTGFATKEEVKNMCHPQKMETFTESKLDWSEIGEGSHAQLHKLYKAGLKLRHDLFVKATPSRDQFTVEADDHGLTLHYTLPTGAATVRLQMKPGPHLPPQDAIVLLRSNAPEFGGSDNDDAPECLVYIRPEEK